MCKIHMCGVTLALLSTGSALRVMQLECALRTAEARQANNAAVWVLPLVQPPDHSLPMHACRILYGE
jgi:hypothetical protein